MHIQVLLYTIIIERRHRVTTFDCHWKQYRDFDRDDKFSIL